MHFLRCRVRDMKIEGVYYESEMDYAGSHGDG